MKNRSRMTLEEATKILKTATTDLKSKRKSKLDQNRITHAIGLIELNLEAANQVGAKIDTSLEKAKNVLDKYKTALKKYIIANKDVVNKSTIMSKPKTPFKEEIYSKFLEEDKDITEADKVSIDQAIGKRKDLPIQAVLSQAHKFFQDRLSDEDFKRVRIQKEKKLRNLPLNDQNDQDKQNLIEEIEFLKKEENLIHDNIDKDTGFQALEKALENYHAVLASAKDPKDICEAYIGIGKCYHAQGKLEIADDYYKKAHSISSAFFNKYAKIWNKQLGNWNVNVKINPTIPEFLTKGSLPPLTIESPPPVPPKTPKMVLIGELKKYTNKYNQKFFSPWLMHTEIQAANKLINFLQSSEKLIPDFNDKELTALSQGELGKILKNENMMVAISLLPNLITKLTNEIAKDKYRITSLKAGGNRK